MNKVVTIHLDGIAYQLEEGAYDALRAYLDKAGATLAANPDKDEIVKDLEQAIGTKLSAYLSAHKNVVTAADVEAVLKEMGPVAAEGDAESGEEGAGQKSESAALHKKLYRIREGEWIAGVSTGLAAYLNVDVTLVRIVFVLLGFITHGAGLGIYGIMWLVVPVARTSKDFEQAAGVPPVTAQELVDRARKSVEDFANSGEWQSWKNNWKEYLQTNHDAHLTWKQQRKAFRRAQKQQWKAQMRDYGRPKTFLSELSEFIWSMFGLFVLLFGIWYLYHHVHLVQQFIDFVHTAWDSFFAALARALGNK